MKRILSLVLVSNLIGSVAYSQIMEREVIIDVLVTELPDRTVRITGKTNLPVDTHLILIVYDRAGGGFHEQTKCSIVDDGSFSSKAFGSPNGLKNGAYTAMILVPLLHIQSDNSDTTKDGKTIIISAKKEFIIGKTDAETDDEAKTPPPLPGD